MKNLKIFLFVITITAAISIGSVSAGVNGIEIAGTNESKHKLSKNVQLRCWQHGELIFEENNYILSSNQESDSRMIELKNKKNAQDKLYLVELNTSICLIRQK